MSEQQQSDHKGWISVFDQVAADYDQIVPFFSAFARRFVEWIDPVQRIDVLDIATGRGAIIAALLERGGGDRDTYTGIDLSQEMLRHTAKDFADRDPTKVRFQMMDAQHLAFDDETFDLVTCGFALHLFNDPASAINEVFRTLRPRGWFAFSTPGPAVGFFDSLTREFARRLPETARDQSRLRAIPMLTDAGFVGIETTEVEIHLPVGTPEEFWNGEMAHGRRRFFEQLSAPDLAELRARLFTFLNAEQAGDGIMLDRGASFWKAQKPGGRVAISR